MKLVHASISENNDTGWNGKAKAGDQTGKEVCVRSWFSYPWNLILRYPDNRISDKASAAAVKLANSNLVGYNQSSRNTLYNALKSFNFDVDAYIKSGKKTETDCSAFVYAVYACFIPAMRSDNNAPVTYTMKKMYNKWGFENVTSSAYLVNGTNLINGDIVVNEEHHTALVTDGNSATVSTTPINVNSKTYTSEVLNAITILAKDVIRGGWGNGEERKNNLFKAIQNEVNKLSK